MDEPTNPLDSANLKPGNGDLRDELQAARGILTLLLISMTCIAAAVALYLYRQVVNLNRQVIESKRVAMEYQTNSLPKIAWFIDNLQAYSKTNPDFTPILAKYNLLPGTKPAVPPANGAAPAPAPAPKK